MKHAAFILAHSDPPILFRPAHSIRPFYRAFYRAFYLPILSAHSIRLCYREKKPECCSHCSVLNSLWFYLLCERPSRTMVYCVSVFPEQWSLVLSGFLFSPRSLFYMQMESCMWFQVTIVNSSLKKIAGSFNCLSSIGHRGQKLPSLAFVSSRNFVYFLLY